ncbi:MULTISPECIES: TetR family transcriptional regulator [Saccharopolyspora]|uniref:TetR family transcriptional regulator n=1 Tax=Saccharopolyspora elongata TaxID=2530387 RepID=A0A4R4Z625_9PSEU|nr:TetR family transcriptional regulator [Saccharopolyspora elongata]TDD52534.1 TetR family transcriptional regulator [Saccharopolyspora elongata]
MNLTERRKAATQLEIARIAAALFAERGSDGTTAEAIAERAGVSLRTFYRYFRTKQDSVAPLLAFGARRWQDLLAATPRDIPLPDALEQAAERALAVRDEEDVESFGWTRGLLRAAAGDPALLAVWASVNQESEQQLVPLLAERAADDLQIRLLAAAATAAIRVAVEAWAVSDAPADGAGSAAELAVRCMRELTAGLGR